MRDFGATGLSCTPSYALYLAEAAHDRGLGPDDLPIRVGYHGAEPWTNEMRVQIERGLGIDALDIYGLSEMGGPGVSFECLCKGGMHVNEDHYLVEIVDPETLQPRARGHRGRARLHDAHAARPAADPLPHARPVQRLLRRLRLRAHLARMSKPVGRTDDMLIIRGVNVFPSQIEEVLMSDPGDRAPLPDRRRPQGPPRHGRGLDRGLGGHLPRDDGRPRALRARRGEAHLRGARHPGQGQSQGAEDDPAQRGQGRARDRQAEAP